MELGTEPSTDSSRAGDLDGGGAMYLPGEIGAVGVDLGGGGGWNPVGGRAHRIIRRPTRRTHIQVHRVQNPGGAPGGNPIQS